ncbi:DNA phosphorothioation-dependent restriction protein DptG [Clostridium sp. ZBS13]|uniref:DNA phosphorothioation-dependent restriction protein DptG n=1 Tax=Clostridium sp. ZBS13 TaxID=2949971 RepID=UPI00207A53C7|nr:DNA phosphorothioation-dependent restriction protein DptG [Clostridium sp. ZBS13]
MDENRIYELDLEKIATDFKFNETSLTHSQCKEFKLLPYAANEKTLVSNFEGVVGSVSRIICDKEIKNDFNTEDFIENVVDEIGDFEGETSKDTFRDIINTMFVDKDNLIDFNIKTLNYISSTNSEEKIAKFLYSVFFDNELKEVVKKHYDRDVKNILYKLVLNALPELNNKKYADENYKCYLPFIKDLFCKDLKFLISDEELYKNSLKRFLEYYNMFYISQLAIKLSQFEAAKLDEPDKVYYTLSFESTSKNRTAYKFGWALLKGYVDDLFSHVITLEFLNHNNFDEQLGYKELFDTFSKDDGAIEFQLEGLCESYISRRQDGIVWDDFLVKKDSSGNKAFDKAYKLFEAVKYQFQGKASTRTRANDAYKKWFIKFVEDNFAKRRGSLGYNLNLTEEDIILLTKICIKNNDKLKLSILFTEFEKRGISLDRDSRAKIIQLYEKLNLLEKKSDSGDAQYVRSIL